jgi:4'-phosphopantetheinyl transferase
MPIPMNVEVYFAPVRVLGDDDLQLLSADERQRAARFRFEADRRRFVLARCAVRLALARVLGVAPQAVPLRIGPHGKPELAGQDRRWTLSLSHAGDYIALALARDGRRVGIDIDQHQATNVDRIAEDHFCPRELQWLREGGAGAAADVQARFYRIWTLKEAYLKACGIGLAGAPSSVDVSDAMMDPAGEPQFPQGKTDIAVQSIDAPAAGYSAALAADGRDWRSQILPWDWNAGSGGAETAGNPRPLRPAP